MKTLHTIPSFGAKSGGTSTCTYDLLSAMNSAGCSVDLLTPSIVEEKDHLMGQDEEWIRAVPYDCRTPFGFSQNVRTYLEQSNYDLYHVNGLWMYSSHITCSVARKKNKPYVITPHGMLYPDALHRSYWKKWPMRKLFFDRDIAAATCLHATCEQEMKHIRAFGYTGPIAVIANPAVIPADADALFGEAKSAFLRCSHARKLGFLGRLHRIKKVENLLYAVAALGGEARNAEIVIMGKGDDEYEAFLRAEVQRLGLKNISFLGFVNGHAKFEALAQLSALFVPSDFENFGMIVTEALSVGTPVMASLGTPWEVLNERHCGWWIDRAPENIAHVMKEVITMPVDDLLAMGQRGRELVNERFTAPMVAKQMAQLYEWIINGGEKPKFVYE